MIFNIGICDLFKYLLLLFICITIFAPMLKGRSNFSQTDRKDDVHQVSNSRYLSVDETLVERNIF